MNDNLRAIDIRYNIEIIGRKDINLSDEDYINDLLSDNESAGTIKDNLSDIGCPESFSNRFKNSCQRHNGRCIHCWKQRIDEHEDWEIDEDTDDYTEMYED